MINYMRISDGYIIDVFPTGFIMYFTDGSIINDNHSVVYMVNTPNWELLI